MEITWRVISREEEWENEGKGTGSEQGKDRYKIDRGELRIV